MGTLKIVMMVGFAEVISVSIPRAYWSQAGAHGALCPPPPETEVFPAATMKASSKSSSSASITGDVDEKEYIQRFCQSTAPLETAWNKLENYGHSFSSCPNYRTSAQCEISKLLCDEKEDGGYEIKSEDELKLKILEEKLREKKRYLKSRELKLEEFEGNLRERERELRQLEGNLRERERELRQLEGNLRERERELRQLELYLREKERKFESLSSKRVQLLMIAVFLGLIFMMYVIRCI